MGFVAKAGRKKEESLEHGKQEYVITCLHCRSVWWHHGWTQVEDPVLIEDCKSGKVWERLTLPGNFLSFQQPTKHCGSFENFRHGNKVIRTIILAEALSSAESST